MPVAAFVPAIIGAGGAIAGASIAAKGAKKAADAQVGAAQSANDTQWNIFQQQRTDQMPWLQAGTQALARLNAASEPGGDLSFLTSQPGYKFGLDQGINAITQSAAARGLLGAGSTLKALNVFGQDYAGTKFGDYWNRQAGLAGVGQTAVNQLGAAGQNYANQFGNNALAAGNARASAYQQNGQTTGNLIGQVAGIGANYLANRAQFGPVNPVAWSPTSYASQAQGYAPSGYLNGLF